MRESTHAPIYTHKLFFSLSVDLYARDSPCFCYCCVRVCVYVCMWGMGRFFFSRMIYVWGRFEYAFGESRLLIVRVCAPRGANESWTRLSVWWCSFFFCGLPLLKCGEMWNGIYGKCMLVGEILKGDRDVVRKEWRNSNAIAVVCCLNYNL